MWDGSPERVMPISAPGDMSPVLHFNSDIYYIYISLGNWISIDRRCSRDFGSQKELYLDLSFFPRINSEIEKKIVSSLVKESRHFRGLDGA